MVLDSFGTDKRVKGIVVGCLKMGFGKTAMRIKFPDLCVKVLPRLISGHHPLLI